MSFDNFSYFEAFWQFLPCEIIIDNPIFCFFLCIVETLNNLNLNRHFVSSNRKYTVVMPMANGSIFFRGQYASFRFFLCTLEPEKYPLNIFSTIRSKNNFWGSSHVNCDLRTKIFVVDFEWWSFGFRMAGSQIGSLVFLPHALFPVAFSFYFCAQKKLFLIFGGDSWRKCCLVFSFFPTLPISQDIFLCLYFACPPFCFKVAATIRKMLPFREATQRTFRFSRMPSVSRETYS